MCANEALDLSLTTAERERTAGDFSVDFFGLIVSPSEEGRQVGEIKKDPAATEIARRQYWSQLLAEAKT